MTARNLLLSGGIYHPFAETSAVVAEILAPLGVESTVSPVREGLARLADEGFDLLTINALAFSMTQAEKYAPLRDGFAFTASAADRAAIEGHLARGGGLLGLHTAAICFDGWEGWPGILGAGWVWGRSHHPVPEYVTVQGAAGFTLWDELYCDLALDPEAEVLATATSETVAEPQPVLTRKGRAVYLALGHDLTGVSTPGYAGLLERAARLALGRNEGGR